MSALQILRQLPIHAVRAFQALPLRRSRSVSAVAPAESTVRQRQAELASFYSTFEDLVELLCDAAQYGPAPHLDAKYEALRETMQRGYPPIRRYTLAFMRHEVEDTVVSLDRFGHATDAIESLYAAPTLDQQLRADDGLTIQRMIRAREALNQYAEYLRQLPS